MVKKLFFLMTMSLGMILPTMAQNIPSYVPTNGLVGWWPFNGNANDESGNGNNGTVNGATLTNDRNGSTNAAYNFTNSLNVINIPHSSSLNLSGAMSFSFWLNSTDVNAHQVIMNKATGGTSNSYILQLSPGNDTKNKIWLNCGGLTQISQLSNPVITANNQWYHVTVVYDLQKVSFYINGQLTNTYSPLTSSTPTNTNPLTIGRDGDASNSSSFKGKLDDIAIYNRALTQQEITALYTSTPPCTNPKAIITPQGNTTFCQGGFVGLNASTGTNYTYQWYNNGQPINGATIATYQATATGSYMVKITDGACNATSNATTVVVNVNPTVMLNTLPSIIYKTTTPIQLMGNPSGGIYTGEGISGGILYVSNAKLGKQTYTYNYTSPQGCNGIVSRSTIIVDTVGNVCNETKIDTVGVLKIKVQLTTGIYANQLTNVIVYPNPTSDVLIIDASDVKLLTGYAYRIVDLQGKEVYKAFVSNTKTEISLKSIGTKGTYILHIIDGNGNSIKENKIILE
jgi:hypothetical protein